MTSITNLLKKHFDNAELLFTDTDSLTYEIKSEDVYEEFFMPKYLFDLSNYPKDSKFLDPTIKKAIGKMKDVSEEKIIDKSVALKAKIHSTKNIDDKEFITAKVSNTSTEFNELKNIFFNKNIFRDKMKRIQSKEHKVKTCEISKISLPCFDDKRFALDDEIHALAYFHKDLRKYILTDDHKKKKRFKKILIKGKDSYI